MILELTTNEGKTLRISGDFTIAEAAPVRPAKALTAREAITAFRKANMHFTDDELSAALFSSKL